MHPAPAQEPFETKVEPVNIRKLQHDMTPLPKQGMQACHGAAGIRKMLEHVAEDNGIIRFRLRRLIVKKVGHFDIDSEPRMKGFGKKRGQLEPPDRPTCFPGQKQQPAVTTTDFQHPAWLWQETAERVEAQSLGEIQLGSGIEWIHILARILRLIEASREVIVYELTAAAAIEPELVLISLSVQEK